MADAKFEFILSGLTIQLDESLRERFFALCDQPPGYFEQLVSALDRHSCVLDEPGDTLKYAASFVFQNSR